ncbi:MAG: lyase family protein [Candidatus Pacearchaeota archaeon]|nr:lyase family protein [Candidatus Pacearchaeota archaeon]
MAKKSLNLVGRLKKRDVRKRRDALRCISPDDARYTFATNALADYLSYEAEIKTAAYIQYVLLETRAEFGKAERKHVRRVKASLDKFDPLNALLIEDEVTHHDQIAVIDEIGRHVPLETKALLHPGTTSYDIVDTLRAYLLKKAWFEKIRGKVCEGIEKICQLSELSEKENILQVGRTHLQDTSPVPFSMTLAGYARRFAEMVEYCDRSFNDLRGKVSGIVGTGASVDMVIGEGKSLKFEKAVLKKLGLKPDYTATQITGREKLCLAGEGITLLAKVLGNFANDMRILYSSAVGEVNSRKDAARLGGSSADAGKNNPINWENIAGKAEVIASGMHVLHAMLDSNLGRDLRNSVQGRYQPQTMMVQTYEAFSRLYKELGQFSINADKMQANLAYVRENSTEAMTAILRARQFIHSEYGEGHNFVKVMAKEAKTKKKGLLNICLRDDEFREFFGSLPKKESSILLGDIEKYVGHAYKRAKDNREYSRRVIKKAT